LFTGDISSVKYIISGDVVEVDSEVPVKCFDSVFGGSSNTNWMLCN
jgi:hypothetical protein